MRRWQAPCALLLFVALCSAIGWGRAAAAGAASDVTISLIGVQFAPPVFVVRPGSTVTWANTSGVFHSVVADDGSFSSGAPSGSFTFSHQFDTAGTYRYYCSVHGGIGGVGMSGTIIVTAEQSVYIPIVGNG